MCLNDASLTNASVRRENENLNKIERPEMLGHVERQGRRHQIEELPENRGGD
jgi:hypothetical protein